MRHKYETRGIVLSRSVVGEMSTFVTLVTPDLGLVRALTQGARKSGAKLAHALTTFSESDVVLVHGRDGWRLTGAVLEENWSRRMKSYEARSRAGRVSGLLLRLVAGEAHDPALFPIMRGFLDALTALPDEAHESAEVLAALRILAALGLDAGAVPGETSVFAPALLAEVMKDRTSYITRINRGITASEL